MYISICSRKGISMIEVLIALFLLNIGILALISLQPTAWRLSGKSDLLGRAAAILHRELESNEIWIMNENNAITEGTTGDRGVYASGQTTAQSGDALLTVNTTTTNLNNGSWRVAVRVDYPGNPGGSIADSMVVTRQKYFQQ